MRKQPGLLSMNLRTADELLATSASKRYLILKRAFDIAMAFVGLLLSAPILLLIAIAIKFDSRGTVLFIQERVGLKGVIFYMPKFRTLRSDCCYDGPKPAQGDPRITKVGRFLRRSGLDELPQLWSVLVGDMSLVGPRPEMPFIVSEYGEREKLRLFVQPGITGVWQLYGDRSQPMHCDLELDLKYIQARSLAVDLQLLAITVWLTLSRVFGLHSGSGTFGKNW